MNNYSHELASLVEEHLTKKQRKFEFYEDRGVFRLEFGLESGLKSTTVIISIKENSLTCYAYSPIDATPARRLAVAEYITRINYYMRAGNFEMDFEDGEIRYKCYLSCENQAPTDASIFRSMMIPVSMLDRYGDGLLEVIYGNADPKEVYKKVEKS